MGLIFSDGEVLAASNTRSAFSVFSDQLEADGHAAIIVSDGDRDPAEQLRIWHERYHPGEAASPPASSCTSGSNGTACSGRGSRPREP